MHRLLLIDPSTGEQVTTWIFGTTLDTSAIARNDVVSGKQYPTGESEHFTFNRQSEPVTFQENMPGIQLALPPDLVRFPSE